MASQTMQSASGTITLGGTAQTALAANHGRQYLMIHNVDAAADLWINVTGTAAVDTQGSVRIPPKGSVFFEGSCIATNALSVIGATTGNKFTIWYV